MKRLICLLLWLPAFSCRKTAPPSPDTVYSIYGIVTDTDYVSHTGVVWDSAMVYIKHYANAKPGDTSYLYAVQADINGYFVFYNLPDTARYLIYVKGTRTSMPANFTAAYNGADSIYVFPRDTVRLIATDNSKENGIKITTCDTGKNIIPNVSVFFYTSREVALADSEFTGVGATAKAVTNSSGTVTVSKLPAGLIYINAALIIDSGNVLKEVGDTQRMQASGLTGTTPFFNDTLRLK